MSLTNDQLGKAIVASGVMPADELKAFWSSLPPEQRPKNGETFAKLLVDQEKLSKFQASELLSGNNTPLVLGDYVLQGKIGAGGMGQVFKAHHRRMKRMAAIKLLPPELTKDADTVKRFEREVEAAAKLTHPNIVQTFDAGVQRGVWYLVMEYVEGRDLADTVAAQGQLPIATAVNYIRQAARGLAFAHKNGVVHRDIKPANLLLDKEGTIKILDMGLARLDDGMAAAKEGLTQSGQVMGTVDYMAPEQAFDTRHADARADIYSLGCTLYRLLTAQNMYDGESLVQKLMAHQTRPIPVLSKVRADVPAALNTIFAKMVAKQPQDRYQTMAEVEAALAKLDDPAALANPSTKNDGGGLTGYFKGLLGGKAEPTAAGAAVLSEPTAAQIQPDDVLPTISLNNPLQSTDPVSSRTIQTVRQNTPRPMSGKKPPIWKRPIVMAAGLGGLALVLLGIWVIIKDKDGNEVARVAVPDGGTATVQTPVPGNSTTTAVSPPAVNYALQFDGDSTSVDIPRLSYPGTGAITIEATLVPAEGNNIAHVMTLSGGPGKGLVSLRTLGTNLQGLGGLSQQRDSLQAPAAVQPGRRLHVALTWNGSSEPTLFVDGKRLTGSMNKTSRAATRAQFVIGGNPAAKIANELGFRGIVDEVRVSNTVRYEQEYKPQVRLDADKDTLALYHFDEGQGDVLNDSSGNNHHGKIVGAKWVKADSQSPQTLSTKYCLDFAAPAEKGTARVELPKIFDLAKPLTVEMYVTPRSRGGQNRLLFGAEGQAILRLWGDNTLDWSGPAKQGTENRVLAYDQLPIGKRSHVAAVSSGTELRLFINGREIGRNKVEMSMVTKAGSIGGQSYVDGTWQSFDGTIEAFRISNIARYIEPFQPKAELTPDKYTLLCYDFREGHGDVLNDSSGHNHHGKIVGAKWVKADGLPVSTLAARSTLSFDGKGAVEVPSFSLDPKSPVTFETFVTLSEDPTPTTGVMDLFIVDRGGVRIGFKDYGDNQNLFFQMAHEKPTNAGLRGPTVLKNQRTHIAAVWNGQKHLLFRNGVLVNSDAGSLSPIATPGNILKIAQGVRGTVEEIRVSKTARYEKDFTPTARFASDADTLLLYHLDEGTGDVLHDSSGNNHHGKIVGAKWVRGQDAPLPTNTPGLRLTGDDPGVRIPSLKFDLSPTTIEAWVDVDPANFKTGLNSFYRSESPTGSISLTLSSTPATGNVYFKAAVSDGMVTRQWTKSWLKSGLQHLAAVHTKDRGLALFVNGQRVEAQLEENTVADHTAKENWTQGTRLSCALSYNKPWEGTLVGLRVSQGARYDNDFIPSSRFAKEDTTLALYLCDEGQGDVLRDSSGNNHHGKIVGAKWVRVDGSTASSSSSPRWPFDPQDGAEYEWSAPENLGPQVNNGETEYLWGVSEDETALYFQRGQEAFAARRSGPNQPFGKPETLPHITTNDFGAVSADGLHVAFVKGLPPPNPQKGRDLYLGSRRSTNESFPAPVVVPATATLPMYNRPVLSADGLTLLLWSQNATTQADIWMLTRTAPDQPFSPAEKLRGAINTPEWDMPHHISNDRCFAIASIQNDAGRTFRFYTRSKTTEPFGPGTEIELPLGAETRRQNNGGYRLAANGRALYLELSNSGNVSNKFDLWVSRRVPKSGTAIANTTPTGPAPPTAVFPFDAATAKAHQAAWAKHLGEPVEITNSVGMKLAIIPPGEFMMGDKRSDHGEAPVRLTKPFRFGVHEVTQAQWKAVTGSNAPLPFANPQIRDNLPVHTVTWNQARDFCQKLTAKERAAGRIPNDQEYRLPTEAEWEFACRAGTLTNNYWGTADAKDYAWFMHNSTDDSVPPKIVLHEVGQKKPNPWGLYDLNGNASEWCEDWMVEQPITGGTDPQGTPTGKKRCNRGGGAASAGSFIHSWYRYGSLPEESNQTGLRVVLSHTASVAPARPGLSTSGVNTTPAGPAPPAAKAPFDAAQAKAHQAVWAKHLGTQVETVNSVGQKMILIPPGEFLMGSTDEQVEAALKIANTNKTDQAARDRIRNNERPQHKVVITKPLLMSATEVTIGQFKKFATAARYQTEAEKAEMAANAAPQVVEAGQPPPKPNQSYTNPGYDVTDDSPSAMITWNDATAYCKWLSEQEKTTYRLPTEAEWEYACRAGTTTQFSFGDDLTFLNQYAWYKGNAAGKSHPVGMLLPNAFGLFDMYGNLAEWCGDFYDEKWYSVSPPNDPNGPAVGSSRVVRGGHWFNSVPNCRSPARYYTMASYRMNNTGFRVVRELNDPAKTASVTPSPTVPAAASGKLWMHDPAFPQWVKDVQTLPAEKQIEAVSKKLMELNPGFDGKVAGYNTNSSPVINNGVVITFGLNSNYLTDISPVRALVGLKTFRCNSNKGGKLSDLSPLQGLKLSLLYCSGTAVNDLSPLKGMPLDSLFCDDTQVRDLSPLAEMNLVKLLCKNAPVSDVTTLHSFSSLKDVNLVGTKVTLASIAALQKALPNCRIDWDDPGKPDKPAPATSGKLFMHDPAFPKWVKDVQAMPADKQIEAVSKKLIELNPGFDGVLLGRDKKGPPTIQDGVVKILNFDPRFVTDLSPLRGFAGLVDLNCGGMGTRGRVQDLSPLAGLPLTSISVYVTGVNDLTPLQGMSITYMNCGDIPITDLQPLKDMPIRNLYIPATKISDLSPLAGSPLQLLNCERTPVADLSPLEKCRDLTSLNVKGTKVTAAQVAALQKALPKCKIEWDDPAKKATP